MPELVSELESLVKEKLQLDLAGRPTVELASLTWVQDLALEAMQAVGTKALPGVWPLRCTGAQRAQAADGAIQR